MLDALAKPAVAVPPLGAHGLGIVVPLTAFALSLVLWPNEGRKVRPQPHWVGARA